jgi:hypothetical protein
MKNIFGLPARVGHLSAVKWPHKLSGLYGWSLAYRIPSSPWDRTKANTKLLWDFLFTKLEARWDMILKCFIQNSYLFIQCCGVLSRVPDPDP